MSVATSAENVSTLTLDSNNTQAIMDYLGLNLANPSPEFYNELGILGLYQLKDLQFISSDNPSLTRYLSLSQQNSLKYVIEYITLCNTSTTIKFNPTLSSEEMKKITFKSSTTTEEIGDHKSNKVDADETTASDQTEESNFSGIISDIKKQVLEMVKPFTS